MTPRITNEQRIEMAVARYTPDAEGRLPKLPALVRRFGRSTSVISRAVQEALARGLVRLECVPSPARERVKRLEREVRERFTNLDKVFVVESSLADPAGPEALGQAMAAWIADGLLFRAGDVLGVGGGRSVLEVGRALRKRGIAIRVKNVHVTSMTGYTFAHGGVSGEYVQGALEADHHAGEFASAFGGRLAVTKVLHPIVYGERSFRGEDATLDNKEFVEMMGLGEWAKDEPNIAVIGTGTLSADHHWVREIRAREDTGLAETRLDPIIGDLKELLQISDDFRKAHGSRHGPIAEVCNNFFVVDPPAELTAEVDVIREDARACIGRVNRRLITFKMDRLRDIDRIFLIAGTPEKARTIYHLVVGWPNVRVLCTDQECAERMLGWND